MCPSAYVRAYVSFSLSWGAARFLFFFLGYLHLICSFCMGPLGILILPTEKQ